MKKHILTLAFVALATVASYAQGTVQFAGSTLIKQQLNGAVVPTTAGLLNYGLFFGTTAEQLQLAPTLGVNDTTSAGRINVASGTAFQIGAAGSDVDAGKAVFIQIRAWSASFASDWQAASRTQGAFFGQTDVRSFVLGPATGPGTVLWSNSDVTKFRPLTIATVGVPEPSTIALGVLGLGSLLLFRRRK